MDTFAQLVRGFQRPPVEHSPVPFWFLNEVLEPERLAWQLGQMHAQHVDAVVLHPRPGMVTEYLSPDFWRAIEACVNTAKELGMRVWLYDEYPWASGIAGGRVPEASSDYVMNNMDMIANDVTGPIELDWPLPRHIVSLSAAPVVSTTVIDPGRMVDLTPFVTANHLHWQVPEGVWRIMAVIVRRGLTTFDDPYGTQFWADLTNPEGVNLFMKLTHEEYLARFGSKFGKTIWGVFTDEPPSTFPAWGVNVPKRFRELKGYELSTILPMLWYDGGPRTAVARCDYFGVVAQCYEEAFFARTGKWCEEHQLELGGHLLLEENLILNTRFMTDAFRQLRHLQAPGIDWIFPGRIPAYVPKLAASIAHNYGRKRVLSETFALAGWAADMQWMRWQTQWEFVHGIDLLVPHAFFYSISDTVPIPPAPDNIGYRWYDCPPSMFYQQPYWRFYHCFADMEARSSYLLSRGTHVAQAAVYYPIESVWADFALSDGWLRGVHANALDVPGTWMTADKLETGPAAVITDSCYRAIIDGLREHNLDVDIVDHDSVLSAEVTDGALHFRQEQFRVLILPAVHMIHRATLTKLAEFWRNGGVLIALRSLPTASPEYGANDPEIARLVTEIWGQQPLSASVERRAILFSGGFETELQGVISQLTPAIETNIGSIYSQQRHLPDMDFYYLVSMHAEAVSTEVCIHSLGTPELWDPMTGHVQPVNVFRQDGGDTTIPVVFEPYGAVFISLRPGTPAAHVTSTNLRQVTCEVQGNQILVHGIATEPGLPRATVKLNQQEYDLTDCMEAGIDSQLIGDNWDFETLPVPTDPFWHADLDQLDLMIPSTGVPARMCSGSWSRHGLAGFSGIGRYTQTIEIPQEWLEKEVTLDLGQVRVACQVYLNGLSQGERTWAPYSFVLQGLKAGANELVVEVANTLANYISVRHADSRQQWAHFSDEQLDAGLLGPVHLYVAQRVSLAFVK
ncbi:MAG: glycosyl hydrolase [Anaerolineae bacterium]